MYLAKYRIEPQSLAKKANLNSNLADFRPELI